MSENEKDYGFIAYSGYEHYHEIHGCLVDSWESLDEQDKNAWRTAAAVLMGEE